MISGKGGGTGLAACLAESGRKLKAKRREHPVRDGDTVVVPAGTYHNVINTSKTAPLKLYTLYSPPNHPAGTVHKTKAEAEAAEALKHS